MAEENSSIIPVQVQVRVPQDLQEEVQVRLPVRSLLRFKSVCKTWRSIIQSRPFIALYGQHRPRGGVYNCSSSELQSTISWTDLNKMVPGLNLEHECKTLKTKPKDGERQLRVYYVFGPLSNGVYCLTAHSLGLSSCSYYVLSGKIALCNPATREYKFADPFPREFRPMLSDISSSRIRCRLHLGFGNVQYKINSSSSEEESLDYRIVALIQYGRAPSYSFLAFVYSVQRREWKKIVDYEPGKRKVGEAKATDAFDLQQGRRIYIISYPLEVCTLSFFKGCCHWTIAHRDVSFSVLLFNVADQSFSLLGGPPNHMDYVTDNKVYKGGDALVLHDHLAFIRNFNVHTSNPKGMQTLEIGVWMMMEYGVEESWTRIYKINPGFNGFYNRLYGIDYEEEEEECRGIRIKRLILQVRLDDYKEEIISCDKAGHQVIRICDPEAEFNLCWNTPGISTYIETLERL